MLIWKILKILGLIWMIIACALILSGSYMIWHSKGFGALMELYNPFNLFSWIANIITIAPGYFLYTFSNNKLRQ